jgi:hypothetical protein
MLALVIVMGTVEFLGPGGVVTGRASASTQLAEYERYCRANRLAVPDVLDG